MARPGVKVGPLNADEIRELWKGAVDESYSEPLELAGEGEGFEAFTQFFSALERVSQAIDRTFQSLYIKPHSSQSDAPAAGGVAATVTLMLSRTRRVHEPIVLVAGTLVEEKQTDWGKEGGVEVLTGRRYALTETFVFHPGDIGPFPVPARAERFGYGYNNPLPGSIRQLVQPGAGLENNRADVTGFTPLLLEESPPEPMHVRVDAENQPDVFIPEHIGQTVLFVAGANVGRIGRVYEYGPPDLSDPDNLGGGTVKITRTTSLESNGVGTHTGTFVAGEKVTLRTGSTVGPIVGYAILRGARESATNLLRVTLDMISATGAAPAFVVGMKSGATAQITIVAHASPAFVDETDAAAWRVLDWADDYGLVATNTAKPTGGRVAMLDTLGEERDVFRATGEGDESYRKRIFAVADNITPNALRRAANRVLAPRGSSGCLREVGTIKFQGFYWDVDAFDYDFVVRPADRFKLLLDDLEFRAFYLMGVPRYGDGEFGFAFDGTSADPFDLKSAWDAEGFLDGFPAKNIETYGAIWRALTDATAGGVGFDLYLEEIGCTP